MGTTTVSVLLIAACSAATPSGGRSVEARGPRLASLVVPNGPGQPLDPDDWAKLQRYLKPLVLLPEGFPVVAAGENGGATLGYCEPAEAKRLEEELRPFWPSIQVRPAPEEAQPRCPTSPDEARLRSFQTLRADHLRLTVTAHLRSPTGEDFLGERRVPPDPESGVLLITAVLFRDERPIAIRRTGYVSVSDAVVSPSTCRVTLRTGGSAIFVDSTCKIDARPCSNAPYARMSERVTYTIRNENIADAREVTSVRRPPPCGVAD